jgi:hypothetical protein
MKRFVVAWLVFVSTACGAAAPRAAMMAQAPAAIATGGGAAPASATPTATQIPEQLVIEGTLSVQVDEIGDVVPQLHALVESRGGRVIEEDVTGAEKSWNAQLKLRLPPDKVEEVVAFLAKRGEILDRHITASDVSKQLFDQEIALKNLHTTLDRLTQVMATGGLKVPEILQIEQEMTRIRGQIEQIEGDQRYLKDRVALATLAVTITRREGAVTVAEAKLYPGVRGAALVLFDPGVRERVRMGAGIVVHSIFRANSIELDVFEKTTNSDGTRSSNAVIATTGGAVYSDFLGRGKREIFNPYIGGRLGYGYLDGHRFVVQGEVGLELFKQRNLVIDTSARLTGLIGDTTDVGLVVGAGATIAF